MSGTERGGGRPRAIITEHLDPACAAWLAERCDVTHAPAGTPEFETHIADADALVIRTYTKIDAALLDRAPRLRVVGRAGVGIDNIDRALCAARGVRVVYTPDANTQAVAEYVIALILDDLRPRPTVGRAIDVESWKSLRSASIGAKQLRDCTVGILGLGRVGKRVAACLSGFATRVTYHDLLDIPVAERAGATTVGMDELLASSDIVTVHVDDRASNRNLIDAAALSKCRDDVLLINASRGFVADPSALCAFLQAHPGARAVLDVHQPEPPGAVHPLMGLANCRLLPHLGAATAEAHRNMSWVVRDVWRVLSGEQPEHEAPPPGATMAT